MRFSISLVALGVLAAGPILAASHREAPAIAQPDDNSPNPVQSWPTKWTTPAQTSDGFLDINTSEALPDGIPGLTVRDGSVTQD